MRRLVVGLFAAVACVGFGSVTTFAGSGTGAATPFKATYGTATVFTCSGAHVVNKATRPGSKDSETCLVTGDLAGFKAGTYKSDPSLGTETDPNCLGAGALGNVPPYGVTGWISDYFSVCVFSSSWTIVQIDNGDRTFTWNIDAYYRAA